jgi:hypothetical protein
MKAAFSASLLLFLLLSLWTAGCSDGDDPVGPVRLFADGRHLFLDNATADTLYFFLCPTHLVPLIDWRPCREPGTCANFVPPRQMLAIAYDSFWWTSAEGGYDELTVYTWKLKPDGNGKYSVESMESSRVTL